MPKQLIRKYQLDKSQLAFTFCVLSPDGKSYVADWNSTVYSTVLTGETYIFFSFFKLIENFIEAPTDAPKKRKINCPKCLYSFDIIMEGTDDVGDEKVTKKRKQ
jgi:hypothetical protein